MLTKYKLIFSVLFISVLFIQCKQDSNVRLTKNQNTKKQSAAPTLLVCKKPTIKLLDTKKLQQITIPSKPQSNFTLNTTDGIKRINLSPPISYIPVGGISGGLSHFNTYSSEQGLSLSSIACGYLDKKGNLWFGTYGGGVNKFDGKSFTVFNSSHGLANNLVLCITEDRFGNLWFGTQGGGVSMYDGKSFITLNIINGLGDNVVYSIVEDKNGDLWFGTKNGGVSKYTNNNKTKSIIKNSVERGEISKCFKSYGFSDGLGGNTIRAILKDSKDNLWFASEHDGVCKYNGDSFINYNTSNGLANNTVWSIEEDSFGNMWFGTNGAGVSMFDGKTFKTYTPHNGLANNIIWAITKDKKGTLWFGSEGGGISSMDLNNQKKLRLSENGKDTSVCFTTYNTTHGLSNNVVFSITEDNSGNMWFGTYGGGVCRFNGNAIVTYNSNQGLASNVVFSIAEDKNKELWFGSYGGGVTKYDGKTFTIYNESQGLPNNTVWAITKDHKNNLWFGTNGGGVSKYDGKSFTNYNTNNGLPNNIIRCIKEDAFGNLWFGTEGSGVCMFNGTSFTNYKTEHGLISNTIRSICIDKNGSLWFGSEGRGVSNFDGKVFKNYNTTNGLINNVVRSICEDLNGNIWFGTQAGLSCLIRNKTSNEFINYTTENSLPDDYITQVVPFQNDKMIIGTNNGIAMFSVNPSLISTNTLIDLELYNVNTNYPIKDINIGQNAIYVDSKGIIWGGTGDDKTSLIRLDYSLIGKKSTILKPEILSIKINQQKIEWYSLLNHSNKLNYLDSLTLSQQQLFTYGKVFNEQKLDSFQNSYKGVLFSDISTFYPIPKNLILPYNQNNITIEYNAPELSKNFILNYQYMLEGYDKDWSPVIKKTEATFGNINAGEYTFKVKAQYPNGAWSEAARFNFKVLPPFYKTIWAYLCYAIISLFVLRLIIKWRVASFKKRQTELEEIVKQRTVEVIQQKEEAEFQKVLVQEKQKEIVDSINYAKRIQDALLSHDLFLKKNLPNHFVLFKPKDIVSGDFYWSTEYNNRFYLAVCDSTGHGVPGAFMSLLNIGFLTEAIREKNISEPNEILNYVRQRLIESISKDNQKDGMDGVLISFQINALNTNNTHLVIEYAAANNAPILIRERKLIELPKDKMPIGKGEKNGSFTKHVIEAKVGDSIYLYTDGYSDQFGGEKGKKYKRKRLNDLILANVNETIPEQNKILNQSLKNWTGNLEQVDDVCVIGIRI